MAAASRSTLRATCTSPAEQIFSGRSARKNSQAFSRSTTPTRAVYLNESGQSICPGNATTATDAFIAKLNPNPGFTLPIYCTYLGGSGNDHGTAIAVDSSNSAYVTGSTFSFDWASSGSGFQTQYKGNGDAFIAKIGGNPTGTIYPLDYFSYLGGSGTDSGAAIQVNGLQTIYVAGSTTSADFPITINDNVQPVYGGAGDAFVASISTTGGTIGAYSTYLGGSGLDQATGIAIDVFGDTYVAGTTQSTNFPTVNPFQATLDQGVGNLPDAFVSNIGPDSMLVVTPASTSPSPNPINAGSAVTFTFNIANNGPDNATHIIFTIGNLPTSGGQKWSERIPHRHHDGSRRHLQPGTRDDDYMFDSNPGGRRPDHRHDDHDPDHHHDCHSNLRNHGLRRRQQHPDQIHLFACATTCEYRKFHGLGFHPNSCD